jgi:hypothetical protein
METKIKNIPSVRKNVFIALLVFVLAFLIYYLIMAMLSPGRKHEAFKNEYRIKTDVKSKTDERIFTDSAYLELIKVKSFLQSRITMAETDSIYLTINLTDSLVNLEISGVIVHKAKIKRLKISKMLRSSNEFIISSALSKPFTITKNYSSIPKEPLMIKMAPKDTSEYKPDIIPDTADFEPVNYIMEMDNGINILVYQEEKLNFGDGMNLFRFDLSNRMRNAWISIKSVLMFKVPDYHPFIKIRLPRTDAKIIFRAIPEHGQITVFR